MSWVDFEVSLDHDVREFDALEVFVWLADLDLMVLCNIPVLPPSAYPGA